MKTVLLTHKGWMGLCPVYMTDPTDPLAFYVEPRHWILDHWLDLNTWFQMATAWVGATFVPGYEPGFSFCCTGLLPTPKTTEYDDAD